MSQDSSFNKTIHSRICINSVEWYHEENIKDIYLGSLLLIIILKVISQNSKHQKDQYIFQICYAIIFNTASYVDNINYITSLRLLDLYKSLSTIHQKYYIVNSRCLSSITPTKMNNNNNISSLSFPTLSSPQPPPSSNNIHNNKKDTPEILDVTPISSNSIHKNPTWRSTISISNIPLNIPKPPQPSPTPITPPKLKFEISPCSSDTNLEELFQPIQVRLEKEKKSFSKRKLGPVEDDNDNCKDNEINIDAILYELGCPLKNSKYNGCIYIYIYII